MTAAKKNSRRSLSPFSIKVIAALKKVPQGKVATYGQIAKISGKSHAARAVSWILHSCSASHQLPWHRILNSQGKIAFPPLSRNAIRQERLLQKEGVAVDKSRVDLKKFQWAKR